MHDDKEKWENGETGKGEAKKDVGAFHATLYWCAQRCPTIFSLKE